MPAASLWILKAISNKSSPWKVSHSNPLRQSPVKLNYGWGSGLIWLLIWSAASARILILPIPIIVTLPISFWHWFIKTKNHYVKIYWLHPLSRPQTRSLPWLEDDQEQWICHLRRSYGAYAPNLIWGWNLTGTKFGQTGEGLGDYWDCVWSQKSWIDGYLQAG